MFSNQCHDVTTLRKLITTIDKVYKDRDKLRSKEDAQNAVNIVGKTIELYSQMLDASQVMMRLVPAPTSYINKMFSLKETLKSVESLLKINSNTHIINQVNAVLNGELLNIQLIYLKLKEKTGKKFNIKAKYHQHKGFFDWIGQMIDCPH